MADVITCVVTAVVTALILVLPSECKVSQTVPVAPREWVYAGTE